MEKRGLIIFLVFFILITSLLYLAIKPGDHITAMVTDEVEEALAQQEKVEVLVVLKEKETPHVTAEEAKAEFIEQKKATVDIVQEEVIAEVEAETTEEEFEVTEEFETINAFVAEVTEEGLNELKQNPDVEIIHASHEYSFFLTESVPLINADDAWNITVNGTGITGEGETVCIIDTGIDYTHPALGGCFGAGCKVIGGYDIINDDSNPMDDHSHGTHCAGIATSEDSTYRGVAPGASLVAVKSLSSSGWGNSASIAGGIDWCVNHAAEYSISVISMSIGTSTYHSSTYCDSYDPTVTAAINSARSAGIIVFVASGNEGQTSGLSNPACVQASTPVGSVDKNGNYVSYSNAAPILDLVAPGGASDNKITSTVLSSTFAGKYGTSMATPHAAGVAALLLQYHKLTQGSSLTPSEIEDILDSTGKPTPYLDYTFSRVDAFDALKSLDDAAPVITIISPDDNATVNGSTALINITAGEILETALLEWDSSSNMTMEGSGQDWHRLVSGDGAHSYKIYGTDAVGNLGVSETRSINFNNQAPGIISYYPDITDINIAEPDNQSFNVAYYDPDNDTITVAWYVDGNLSGTGSNFTYLGSYYSAGTYNITAVVTDILIAAVDSHYWNLTINNTNYPPIFSAPIADKTWGQNTNTSINLSAHFYDIDDDNLSFTSTAAEDITAMIEGGIATLIPDSGFTGIRHIIFYAADGINTTPSNNVTLNITETEPLPPNNPPAAVNLILTNSDAGNRTTGALAASWEYSDSDANDTQQAYELSWYKNSNLVSALANSMTVASSYTHKGESWKFSVRVYDGEAWGSWANSSAVAIQNSPPVLGHINNKDVDEKENVTITASATDADGDTLAYYINDSRFEKDGNVFTWETDTGDEGNYYVTVNVTDGALWDSQENIEVEVDPCQEDWECTSWSSCVSGQQTRDCEDLNECGTTEDKPDETKTCTASSNAGGAGGGASTPATESKDVHVLSSVSPSIANKITLYKVDIPITEYSFYVKTPLAGVTITTEAFDAKPSSAKIIPSGTVYKYITIDTKGIAENEVSSVNIMFKIKKEWLAKNNVNKEDVKLQRYVNSQWQPLSTRYTKTTEIFYYYEATSPGFSVYAVTGQEGYTIMAEPEPSEELVSAQPQLQQPSEQAEEIIGNETLGETREINMMLIYIVAAVLAGVLFINVYLSSLQKKHEPGRHITHKPAAHAVHAKKHPGFFTAVVKGIEKTLERKEEKAETPKFEEKEKEISKDLDSALRHAKSEHHRLENLKHSIGRAKSERKQLEKIKRELKKAKKEKQRLEKLRKKAHSIEEENRRLKELRNATIEAEEERERLEKTRHELEEMETDFRKPRKIKLEKEEIKEEPAEVKKEEPKLVKLKKPKAKERILLGGSAGKSRKTKEAPEKAAKSVVKKGKFACPKCGSTDIARGMGVKFCRKCGATIE
jgi:PGF-pre-PGF domain-containing protein